MWARVQPIIEGGRFQPPRVRDIARTLGAREEEVRQLLRRLARMGRLVEVAHDHFYPRPTVTELIEAAHRLTEKSPDGMITAAAFRDCIGTGRKLAIQILDFFDRTGTTMRKGDLRRLREDRRTIFGSAGG